MSVPKPQELALSQRIQLSTMASSIPVSPKSIFDACAVPQAPEDLHNGLRAAYQKDESKDKVNLAIGAYRNNDGNPWILPVVKKVRSGTECYLIPPLT